MEFSSPLAAMRPQAHPLWHGQNDVTSSHMLFPTYQSIGHAFDFRNMSMYRQNNMPPPPAPRDYFSKPVRGSSPTSSLTADLDANFHIDKSPQVSTPRRALFTTTGSTSNNGAQLDTPPIEHEINATPKFASSSPAANGADMMDVTPLPHKAPFFQVTLPSPTPEETPEDSILSIDLLSPIERPAYQPFLQLPERKRPVTRPSLTRAKGWSTSSIIQRPASAENQLPPFRFGNVATTTISSSSTPSLMDSYTESPVEMPTVSPVIMLPPTRRPSISSTKSGSPCSGHIRKTSGTRQAFGRPPRKQMRRSLSMFQHPDDIMKEEQAAYEVQPTLMSMVEVETPEYTLKLPHFIPDGEPDSLPRITQNTMVDVLDQKYSSQFNNVLVIDCRFEYEYDGGHIENAINYNDKQLLAEKLFAEPPAPGTVVIFHCEYSVHRAPLTAKFVRNHDRKVNAANYPSLTYPEVYILDGGYSRFFSEHRSKCQPQNYVEMSDMRHEQACERGMARVKQRQKLFRHQTFTCGQTFDSMDCSPTQNPSRSTAQRSQSTFDIGPDLAAGIGEKFQRRMASY